MKGNQSDQSLLTPYMSDDTIPDIIVPDLSPSLTRTTHLILEVVTAADGTRHERRSRRASEQVWEKTQSDLMSNCVGITICGCDDSIQFIEKLCDSVASFS